MCVCVCVCVFVCVVLTAFLNDETLITKVEMNITISSTVKYF